LHLWRLHGATAHSGPPLPLLLLLFQPLLLKLQLLQVDASKLRL